MGGLSVAAGGPNKSKNPIGTRVEGLEKPWLGLSLGWCPQRLILQPHAETRTELAAEVPLLIGIQISSEYAVDELLRSEEGR